MEYRDIREPEAEVCEPMSHYVKRPLAEVIARASAPVAILQGAHGVGKTTLVKNEAAFRDFHYVTLADEETFALARRQPKKWATSLPRPVVIDDAHRAESLLGTVRRLAPKKPADRPEFVLVTSKALPHEKVSAPNPACFTLFPLTQAEIDERPGCIVDDLFDGIVYRKFRGGYTRSELRTKMRIGGFPFRVTHPVSVLSLEWEGAFPFHDRLQVLGEKGLTSRTSIEQLIEKAILERVLPNPGLSLGVDAVARSCGVDEVTLTGHLKEYEDEFLIHYLTMLDKKPVRKYPLAKTRVHAADTAIAVEAIHRMGHDITVEMPAFAKVLRTLCIGQLVPAVQWASAPTEYHHWKKFDRRMREVDLVLRRDDRLVGITVRNSLAASRDTIGALRFLARDERFARGFIIYMGPGVRQVAENIWAIPVSALWERSAFLDGAMEAAAVRASQAAAAKATHAITSAAKTSTMAPPTDGDEAELVQKTTAKAVTTTTVTTTVTTSTTIEAAIAVEA